MKRSTVACLVAATVLTGCGSPAANTADMVLAPTSDLALPADLVPTVTLSGGLFEVTAQNRIDTQKPIAGAKVCVAPEETLCAAPTDQDGLFSLDVPARARVVLSAKAAGHLPRYQPLTTEERPVDGIDLGLYSDAMVTLFTAGLGKALDPAKAIVGVAVIKAMRAPLSGATIAFAPAAGDGPYYANETFAFDPKLTATSAAGVAAGYNLPPGTYTVQVTAPGLSCAAVTPGLSWLGPKNELLAPAIAGGLTSLTVNCQ